MNNQRIRVLQGIVAGMVLALGLSACGEKERDDAKAARALADAFQRAQNAAANPPIPKPAKPVVTSGPIQQFACLIDDVNLHLDFGRPGNNAVMPLPAIGAVPISNNVLMMDAHSPEEASQLIMQAKEAYRRVPPQCEPYPLSVRGVSLDTSTPFEQYVPLKSGEQMAYLFYAVSKEPPPYETLAKQLYPAYRSELDSFKRQDMLKTIQADIDAKIQAADKQRLIMLTDRTFLDHFDPASKSFPVAFGMGPNRYHWIGNDTSNYHLYLDAPGTPKLRVIPSSEDEARKLEALITERHPAGTNGQIHVPMVYRLYAQVVKGVTRGNEKAMVARVMRVELVDWACLTCDPNGRTGAVIARIEL